MSIWKRTEPWLLWFLLALPALAIAYAATTSDNARIWHILVHPSGETSARLLVVTMVATPLMYLFRGWRWPRWLVRNRRYFGVASFGYALLHTIFYLIDKQTMERVVEELPRFYIWTGWLAFLIFLPLAATSMDYAVRRMGAWWKPLQRWVYAAAVLTYLHWASLHGWQGWVPATIHFGPLVLLSTYRIWRVFLRPRRNMTAA